MTFDGQPANTAPPGSQLLNGRYAPEEQIEERVFFTTWRARDLQTGRPAALYFLKPDYASDPVFVERLQAEIQTAERLDHPGVAPIYEVWRDGPGLIAAGAPLRGMHLRERIRRVAPFPLAVAVDIAVACAEILDAAARQGIVHGDLRPENILVTPEGEVKVVGFGVGPSLAASNRIQLTALADLALYLAPERAQGREPDVVSDVYALGIVLYEMLAAVPPFNAETPLGIAVKHLHEPPPSLRAHSPGVPQAVDGIVLKCLEKDPAARYQSMASLLEDLNRVRDALRFGKPLHWTPAPEPGVRAPASVAARLAPVPVPPAPAPLALAAVEREQGEPSGRLLLLGFLGCVLVVVAAFLVSSIIFRSPPDVLVPNVLGKTQAEAISILGRMGLKAQIRDQYNDRVQSGVVFGQHPDPEANRTVKQGNAVQIFVSRGPEPVTVPDLAGRTLTGARAALRDAGLLPGPVQEQFSEDVPKGEVISQEIAANQAVPRGAVVGLTISRGREPTPVPKTVVVQPTTTDSSQDALSNDPPRREWDVTVRVPETPDRRQNVRIMVEDEGGEEHEEYDEDHEPGEEVRARVTGFGAPSRVTIRVLIDGRQVHERKF